MEPDEIIPSSHWLSLGHDQTYADAMCALQLSLIERTAKLETLANTPREKSRLDSKADVDIVIRQSCSVRDLPEGMLLHDDLLMPLWESFVKALRPLAGHRNEFNIQLRVANVQLSNRVLEVLEPVLRTLPVDELCLMNNGFGAEGEGVGFVARLLRSNSFICNLSFLENDIDCECSALSLVKAASAHPVLKIFHMTGCSIGVEKLIVQTMTPHLYAIDAVILSDNHIGCYGASAILSGCLASNPTISYLELANNDMNDHDASLFANALATNTNLRYLDLSGNAFSNAGVENLVRSVFDDKSLNAIHDSNRTCELKIFGTNEQVPDGIDPTVLGFNGMFIEYDNIPHSAQARCFKASDGDPIKFLPMLQAEGRRKNKLFHALTGRSDQELSMRYLDNVPSTIVPGLLPFLQECCTFSGKGWGDLDVLFQVVSSLPEVVVAHGGSRRYG